MSKLDEILDSYWDEIKQDDKLITTIQAETKAKIKTMFVNIIHGNLKATEAIEEIKAL